MADIKAKFYQLDKRVRSTKRPAETDESTDYNIVFKRPTNIMNPDILIDTNGVYPDFTYCIIQIPLDEEGEEVVTKDLYYFVESITVAANERFEFHLKLDTLATTKDTILATTAYIIYSSNKGSRWIRDDRVPIIARPPEVLKRSVNVTFDWMGEKRNLFEASDDETIVLTTVSLNNGLCHWCMTEGKLKMLVDALTQAGSSVWGSMKEQFGDAMGSIVKITRLPIDFLAMPTDGNLQDIYLGNYQLQYAESGSSPVYLQAEKLSTEVIIKKAEIALPTQHLDFRAFEPYNNVRLRLPFVGIVDVSYSEFAGTAYVECCIDLVMGKIVWTLYQDDDYHNAIATYSGEIGSSIPITATQIQNATALVESLGGATLSLGAAALNPAAGLPGSIASLASAFYHANQKSTNIVGSYSGGRAEYINRSIEAISENFPTACEPEDLYPIEGRPACAVDVLTEYTGFVRTNGFQLGGSWFKEIKDEVNALLDTGIYIE